jgi:hypothetical protein
MKNAVHSSIHALKDRWHLGRQMSYLSAQTKLGTVSSNLHYYVLKQVQLLSLLSMNKCILFIDFKYRLYSDFFFVFIFISTIYFIKFSIYLRSSKFVFAFQGATFASLVPPQINPD